MRRQEFTESDKLLSSHVMETGISARGLASIKSEGDKAYFGGKSTSQIKKKLGVPKSKPWADIAKNNNNNNAEVRKTIIKQQGTTPEDFKPAEDTDKIKKRIQRRNKGLLE